MKALKVLTRIADQGQEIYAFELPLGKDSELPEIAIEGNYTDSAIDCFLRQQTGRKSRGIVQAESQYGCLHIDVDPFSIKAPYRLRVGSEIYTHEDVIEVKTLWADDFAPVKHGKLLYRLYSPAANGPRPLILFLHGGGEGGYDNWTQLAGGFGPAYLAETHPDCYVMAPQAPKDAPTKEEIEAFLNQTFATSAKGPQGWTREYLALVCDEIREMIRSGAVNPERVYVTGYSMGGGGTIRAMSVAPDLFAAAVPVCPTMTPETFAILKGLRTAKIWITASYIDHTLYRHKYLVDGIMHLKDAGSKEAHLTLFSPEELAEYGIGVIPDMELRALFGWNHTCWVPTYHNAHGVMSWMMDQTKSR